MATPNVSYLSEEYQSFIQFVAKADPSFIQKHNDQVMRIYDAITESEDMDEDKRESTAADRIAETNIIPGLLTLLLVQGRTSINGTNLVGQYIAASTVKISNRNGLSLSAIPTRYLEVPMHYLEYYGTACVVSSIISPRVHQTTRYFNRKLDCS